MAGQDEMLRHLMLAVQTGDQQAYARLLQECQAWLLRYFARRIPPAHLDDLVQETLISLHRKRATYDGSRAFLPWLAAIARYRWIDHLRRSYRLDEAPLDENVHVAPITGSPLDKLSLDALLLHLPPAQAEVIRLVKLAGYSIAEAAVQTGQSESLVKVNIHRGIRKMSTLIEEV